MKMIAAATGRLIRPAKDHARIFGMIACLCLLIGATYMTIGVDTARADDLDGHENISLPIAINLGASKAYTAADGRLFLPDRAWQSGSYGHVDGIEDDLRPSFPIAGTDDPTLYLTRLMQWTTYRVDSIPEGQYVVVLHFAEIRAQSPGRQSVFDISIEGAPVLKDVDIFETSGLGRAYVRRFLTEVNDGTLDVVAHADVGADTNGGPRDHPGCRQRRKPDAPQNVEITPSFDATILRWTASSDPAIYGYHIYRSPNLDGPFNRITDQPVYGASYIDKFLDLPPNLPPSFDLWHYQLSTVDLFGNESPRSATVFGSAVGAGRRRPARLRTRDQCREPGHFAVGCALRRRGACARHP